MCSEKLKTLITEKLPSNITDSAMWHRMDSQPDLQKALLDLREIAAALSAEVARVNPGMTDHSVKHFDALWGVSDQVLTADETEKCSAGEAFILGSSFYVHDLGMAFAATKEGTDMLRASDAYKTALERLTTAYNIPEDHAKIIALQVAGRQLHARKARELVIRPLPGLDQYLIETTAVREKWATFIADVSESHHWSIMDVETKLGKRGRIPAPIAGEIDLGYVACALRIIDYAHINFERATHLTRLLRYEIGDESLLHWLAQEHITGPSRQGELLVFGCTRPIENVDAWWLFYEMADGLDREIHGVEEYLSNRADSVGRFSLQGVKGTRSPQSFANFVLTDGFEPVDIRFRPDSIERLISILGGRTLYGDDIYAPVRELLQNSRDAIYLQRAADQLSGNANEPGQITVSIESTSDKDIFAVSDNGVGMTTEVVTNYLLGIASDYWHSSDFFSTFPRVTETDFRPAGKFGIGFLSVFMIGQNVDVETQRRNGAHLRLQISGIGKRGALVTSPPRLSSGTTIRVQIKNQDPKIYNNLDAVVRARAPMLDIPILVNQQTRRFKIEPGWWKTVGQDEFHDFVTQWEQTALHGSVSRRPPSPMDYYYRPNMFRTLAEIPSDEKWANRQPETITKTLRAVAIPKTGKVLVCSKGIAVKSAPLEGIVGIVEVGDLELVAARTEALRWDEEQFRQDLIRELRPKIIQALNDLPKEGAIPTRYGFIADVAKTYGPEVLLQSTLQWITMVDELGNSLLLNSQQVREKLSQSSEVLLSYGPGPWSIDRVSRAHFPGATRRALMFPVPTEHQGSVGSYDDREEITLGALAEHFKSYTPVPILLTTMIDLIASTWNFDSKRLTGATWSRNKTHNVNAHFVKNTL